MDMNIHRNTNLAVWIASVIAVASSGCASPSDGGGDAGAGDGGATLTCADLRADGDCPEHRAFEESAEGSVCLAACEAGFELEPSNGTCFELRPDLCGEHRRVLRRRAPCVRDGRGWRALR